MEMFEIRNAATGEAGPIMSDAPYALAGEYTTRRMVQKTDEQGNLLYLNQTGVETTDAGDSIPAEYDNEGNQITASWIDYEPVMIDDGPLWDWQEIVPTPAEVAQQTAAALESAVDAFMDGKAQEKGFRDRHSFALRAGIPGSSWHAQALVFGAWMDAVNDYCWQVKVDCLEGRRTVPTVDELLAELPALEVE